MPPPQAFSPLDSYHHANPCEHWVEPAFILTSSPTSAINWLHCFGKAVLPLQGLSLKWGSWLAAFLPAITAYGSKSAVKPEREALYISCFFLSWSATEGAISANAGPPNIQQNAFEDYSCFSTSQSIISSAPSLPLGSRASAVKCNLHAWYFNTLFLTSNREGYAQKLKTIPPIIPTTVLRGLAVVVMLLILHIG